MKRISKLFSITSSRHHTSDIIKHFIYQYRTWKTTIPSHTLHQKKQTSIDSEAVKKRNVGLKADLFLDILKSSQHAQAAGLSAAAWFFFGVKVTFTESSCFAFERASMPGRAAAIFRNRACEGKMMKIKLRMMSRDATWCHMMYRRPKCETACWVFSSISFAVPWSATQERLASDRPCQKYWIMVWRPLVLYIPLYFQSFVCHDQRLDL